MFWCVVTQKSCESRRSRQGTNGNGIGKNTTRNHELARDLQERYIAAERPRSLALATTRVPPKGVSDVLVHYLDQCCIDRLVRRVVYFVYKMTPARDSKQKRNKKKLKQNL